MVRSNVIQEQKEKAEVLKQLYKQKFKPALQRREDLRKSIKHLFIFPVLAFMLFITSFGAIIYVGRFTPQIFSFDAALFIFTIWVGYIIVTRISQYNDFFYKHIFLPTATLVDSTWEFDPDAHVKLHHYLKSNLFSSSYNRFWGAYLIKGHIGTTDFECSTIHSSYKQDKSEKVIFDGLFFHADFHKHFKGRTYAFCKYKSASKIKNIKLNSNIKGDLVKMENPEFNRFFTVYSENQQEARYIITPAMMEGMLNIINAYPDLEVHFSFCNSRMYCAIHHGETDIFSAPLFNQFNYHRLYTIFSFLFLNKVIVEELDLNTRIWTKA
jgi:hypothetical protein